jgi:hypothetical protein
MLTLFVLKLKLKPKAKTFDRDHINQERGSAPLTRQSSSFLYPAELNSQSSVAEARVRTSNHVTHQSGWQRSRPQRVRGDAPGCRQTLKPHHKERVAYPSAITVLSISILKSRQTFSVVLRNTGTFRQSHELTYARTAKDTNWEYDSPVAPLGELAMPHFASRGILSLRSDHTLVGWVGLKKGI